MPQLAVISNDLSPARARLADALATLDRVTRSAPALSDAIARLDRAKADEAAALVDIADEEVSQDADLRAWAMNPAGPAPALNSTNRAVLEAKLATARGAADAARRVESGLRSDLAMATSAIEAARRAVDDAAAAVLIEDLERAGEVLAVDIAGIEARILTHFVAVGTAGEIAGTPSNQARAKALEMTAERLLDRGRLFLPSLAESGSVVRPVKDYFDQLRGDLEAEIPALKMERTR